MSKLKLKLVALTKDVVKNLERIGKEHPDGDTGKPRSPNKSIRRALKKAGMWKET